MKDINYLRLNGVDINKSLELFGNIDTYNQTLVEFITSAPEKIKLLESYKNNKDLANFAIYVHSLKSDSKYFGFMNLSTLAANQEMSSKNGDILYVQQNFPLLQKEVNNAVAIANEYLYGNPDNTAPSGAQYANPVGGAVQNVAPTPTNMGVEVAPQPVQGMVPQQPQSTNVAPTQQQATPAPSQQAEVYDKQTVLVVDDSNIIRNFVKRIFSDKYNIGSAKNGQEAIDLLNSNINNDFIIAILLDLNMPGVNGFAVLDYMSQNNLFSKIPVSIISGDSTKDTIDKAFKYTIVDMLSKPFNENDVKRILEKTIMYKDLL